MAFLVDILWRGPSNLSAPAPCGCWRGSRAGGSDTHRMLVRGDKQPLIVIDSVGVGAGGYEQRSRQ